MVRTIFVNILCGVAGNFRDSCLRRDLKLLSLMHERFYLTFDVTHFTVV